MESGDERSRLLSSNQNLDQRLRRLQREVEESQHERYQLLETVNQYKTENQVRLKKKIFELILLTIE